MGWGQIDPVLLLCMKWFNVETNDANVDLYQDAQQHCTGYLTHEVEKLFSRLIHRDVLDDLILLLFTVWFEVYISIV